MLLCRKFLTSSRLNGVDPVLQGHVIVVRVLENRGKSGSDWDSLHFLTVCRYVERHRVRAGLVPRAEGWRWGSLWEREQRHAAVQGMLSPWSVDQPAAWGQWVNEPLPHEELQALRRCVNRGQPFGQAAWQEQTAVRSGLASTFRPHGRPRKKRSQGA